MSKYPGNIITTGADAGYSVYFDGTGDYLTFPTNQTPLLFGNSDFTIEAWVYRASGTGTAAVINGQTDFSTAAGSSFVLYLSSSSTSDVYIGGSGLGVTSPNPAVGQWAHVAMVRTGGTLSTYLNGSRVGTRSDLGTGSINNGSTANAGAIGGFSNNSNILNGYISNLRVIKGSGGYNATSATIIPSTQLLNTANTSLLTCNSPAILDQSSNAITLNIFGNTAVSTFTPFAGYQAYNPALGAATPGIWSLSDALQAASTRQWNMYDPYFNLTTLKLSGTPVTNVPTFITDASTNNFAVTPVGDARAANLSPFSLTTFPNSGSGYFDGSGDQVTIANNAAFDFGSGNFTVECWIYLTGSSGSVINYSNGQTTNSNFAWEIYQSTTTSIQAGLYQGATGYTTSAAYTLNAWNHIAAVRNGNAFTIYVNGVAGATPANVTGVTVSNPAGSTVKVSGYNNATGIITGYVSNVRIVKGVAVYTGNFTTPTAPLTATQPAGTNIAAITGTSTSLLTLQNSQGANNNAFLDSSSNNFLITRNGNTTQGTFTPFSQTGWSNFFNTSFSIYTASNAAFGFGTGSFTLEAWVNFNQNQNYNNIFSTRTANTDQSTNRFSVGGTSNGGLIVYSGAFILNGSNPNTFVPGRWQHFAMVRDGTGTNQTRIYVDGVLVVTFTLSIDGLSSQQMAVGGNVDGTDGIAGYISNARVLKGTALYSGASITVPTAPLSVITNTSLLTCQSNRFRDASTNNFTLTPSGTPSVQAFSPFNTNVAYTPALQGGSGYFDGAGDELSMADNAAFDLSSTDFTIEAWVYPTVINATNEICAQWGGVGNAPYLFKIVTAGRLQFVWTIGGGSGNTLTGTTVAAVVNQWNHVAVTRSGGTLSLFVNGVRDATTGAITGAITNGTNPFYVGSIGGSEYLNGYMSGFRLIKGQALATANFTPPTAPVNATQVGWNGSSASLTGTVSALLNFTNAGIVDTTTKNVPETVGNVSISTVQSKYGGSSMFFDGSGDYLRFLNGPNQNFAFGTADFTIEGWIYLNSSSYQDLLDIYDNNSSGRILFSVNTSRQLVFSGASGATRTSTSTSIPLSTWTHFALCRASSSTRLFIGGVQGNTTLADTTNYTCTTGVVVIGINGFDLASNPLNAYVNDWRISKFARYASNFTPPTSLLQNQ